MLSKKNSKVIVILGPTSSGKSSLAVKIAQEFNGEIISVDSRQIFKEMNLGTGKVSGEWRKSKKPPQSPFAEGGGSADKNLYFYKDIPHHLIDFVSPKEDYNVSHFKKDCEEKIFEIIKQGKIPVLCGGTGFWIQAVVDGVIFPQVKPDPKLRIKLANKSPEVLFRKLKELDPKRAKTVDKKNPARLIRAIEIAKKIGQTPEIKINYNSKSRIIDNQKIEFLQIGIPIEIDKLEEKIKARLKERFEAGMLEEIEKLFEKYQISPKKIQNFGIAYALFPGYQAGKITKKELFEKICLFERQYAKRQLTWFKKDPRIFWSKEIKEIENKIKEFLNLKYS
jgi:tRNA dimethylallyltransferase